MSTFFCVKAWGDIGVPRLCHSQALCWCEQPKLPPEAMLMSKTGNASDGLVWVHGHVHGLCCHHKPCGGPWSILPLTVKSKRLLLLCYGWLKTHSWEREGHGRFLWQLPHSHQPPPPLKSNSLHRKPLKRTLLKCVMEMVKYSSPKLMPSGGHAGGEEFSSIWGAGQWWFDHVPMVYR